VDASRPLGEQLSRSASIMTYTAWVLRKLTAAHGVSRYLGKKCPTRSVMESAPAMSKGAKAVGGVMLLVVPGRGNGQNPRYIARVSVSGLSSVDAVEIQTAM
jgi:hypothetical protein